MVDLKEQLKRINRLNDLVGGLALLQVQIREKDRTARELEPQAASIDASVFDLKAVNPNAVA